MKHLTSNVVRLGCEAGAPLGTSRCIVTNAAEQARCNHGSVNIIPTDREVKDSILIATTPMLPMLYAISPDVSINKREQALDGKDPDGDTILCPTDRNLIRPLIRPRGWKPFRNQKLAKPTGTCRTTWLQSKIQGAASSPQRWLR